MTVLKMEIDSKNEVAVTYGETRLLFDMFTFSSTSLRNAEFDNFELINKFWAGKDEAFKEEVFNLYLSMYEVFQENLDVNELTAKLNTYVRRLAEMHNPEDMAVWAHVMGNIYISPTILTEYKATSQGTERYIQPGARNKTYIRSDYIKLVGLGLALRTMFPIFGEFIYQTREAVGTSNKEYRAGMLMANTAFDQSEAYKKLANYANESINADKLKASPTLAGISNDDHPDWVLYIIIIRRLCVGDLKGNPSKPMQHLVTNIHYYVTKKLTSYNDFFDGDRIQDKNIGSGAGDEESKLSVLEAYKTPTHLTPGDYELMEFWAGDEERIIQTLCPELNRDLLAEAKEAIEFMKGPIPFYDGQAILVQNLIGPYLAPETLLHIRRLNTLKLYAVTQAMLWQYGYKDIACWLTATVRVSDDELYGSTHGSRTNIPRALVEKLTELYPHIKRNASPSHNAKQTAIPITVIKNLIEIMSEHEWKINVHDNWLKELDLSHLTASRRRDWSIPTDIRAQLAKLFIQIGMFEVPFELKNVEHFQTLEL